MKQFTTQNWNSLTWQQLLWLHTEGEARQGEADIQRRLRIWLHLNDLELFGGSYYAVSETDQTPFLERPDLTVDDLSAMMCTLKGSPESSDVSTPVPSDSSEGSKAPVLIVLFRPRLHSRWQRIRSRFGRRQLPFGCSIEKLYQAVTSQTRFLDDPLKLTALPEEYIIIGGTRYKLPEPLLGNLSYEQFNNCQHAMVDFWHIIDRQSRAHKSSSAGTSASPSASALPSLFCEGLDAPVSRFIAHILTPPSVRYYDTERGKGRGMEIEYNYDSRRADRIAETILPLVSPALFPVLYQLFQSSLSSFSALFPYVFTENSKKGADVNPLVSELGTLNAVMKYQGYTAQQEVYDTNALIIFKVIDTMTKEAKDMEKATKKAKRKGK